MSKLSLKFSGNDNKPDIYIVLVENDALNSVYNVTINYVSITITKT